MKMDDKLVETLSHNEQIIQVVAADVLLKEWKENKDTAKLAAGYTAPFLDLFTAKKILKEFGFKANQVNIKTYANGKSYVIFKGYAGNRQVFKGTKYLAANPKVVRMAIGPKGIAESIKGGFVITFVLSVGVEVIDKIKRTSINLTYLPNPPNIAP